MVGSKVNITHIGVGDTMVTPIGSVTNLGVIVIENLSMDRHIAKVSRAGCVSIRNIGMIRKHINQPVVELFTHPLIISRLDSCNSLLHGFNKTQLKRFQQLQNTAVSVHVSRSPGNSLTPHLSSNNYTGYQSKRESPSKCLCLYSRRCLVFLFV